MVGARTRFRRILSQRRILHLLFYNGYLRLCGLARRAAKLTSARQEVKKKVFTLISGRPAVVCRRAALLFLAVYRAGPEDL